MTPASIIVSSPAIGTPALLSWMSVEALTRLLPDLYRQARTAFAVKRSPETCAKISCRFVGNKNHAGYRHTAASRLEMSLAHKRQEASP
jgi:hypothetical protein